MDYTNEELTDMHLMYGLAQGNGREARKLYHERFPNRRLPSHPTFASVDRRLRETGSFAISNTGRGHPRTVRMPETEEYILDRFRQTPSTSTRAVAAETSVSPATVWRVLREEGIKPFHLQRVQFLTDDDYLHRLDFVRWMSQMITNNPQFLSLVLFTDEASFTREGIFNTHNEHAWAESNPHLTASRKYQERFSVNVWAGIFGDHLVGPYLLPDRLTGEKYLVFLERVLPSLLRAVPSITQTQMWFMHDGAPAHITANVRHFLDARYPQRWIGRGGPVKWPARSPDLNPLDFFFWGHMKSLIYESPVNSAEDLVARIVVAADKINATPGVFERVRQSLIHRCQLCNSTLGHSFEQLL